MPGHHISFTVTGADQDAIEEAALRELAEYAGGEHVSDAWLRECLYQGTIRAYPHTMRKMDGSPIPTTWEATVEVELL